jgi:hypothetical protein
LHHARVYFSPFSFLPSLPPSIIPFLLHSFFSSFFSLPLPPLFPFSFFSLFQLQNFYNFFIDSFQWPFQPQIIPHAWNILPMTYSLLNPKGIDIG